MNSEFLLQDLHLPNFKKNQVLASVHFFARVRIFHFCPKGGEKGHNRTDLVLIKVPVEAKI